MGGSNGIILEGLRCPCCASHSASVSAGGSAGEGGEEGQEAGDAGGQAGGEERREHARAARLHGAGWAEQCPSGCRGAIWQPGGDAADAKPVPACSSGSGAWRLLRACLVRVYCMLL